MPPVPFNLENYKRKVKKKVILLMHGENLSPEAITLKKEILPIFKSFNVVTTSYSLNEIKSVVMDEKIYLIIFDHNYFFNKEEESFKDAQTAKEIFTCPFLFLTRNPIELVSQYEKYLFAYEEVDDYLHCPLDIIETQKKIQFILRGENRQAKRFKWETPVKISLLNEDIKFTTELVDLSIVGFSFQVDPQISLKEKDQLEIRIPLAGFGLFHPMIGEVLRLSGRVKRFSIAGKNVGCSIEHETTLQKTIILEILQKLKIKTFTETAKEVAVVAKTPLTK
jgi:hypothetical protein